MHLGLHNFVERNGIQQTCLVHIVTVKCNDDTIGVGTIGIDTGGDVTVP